MWQGSYEFFVNQWGVGHGGFHSQSVVFQAVQRKPTAALGDASRIRLIYDCGSGRGKNPRVALKNAVARMLDDIVDGSTIDLLVISHFDRDHVNGLDHLATEFAKKRIRVAQIWAPVLTKIEALFAITNSGLTGAGQQAYAAFVYDPVGRLAELFDGAEVTLIDPNNEPIPMTLGGVTTGDEALQRDGEVILSSSPGERGLVARANVGNGRGEALWEFQPYVVESTLVGARTVYARVRQLLGKPLDQCSLTDLITLANDASLLPKFHAAVRQHHMQTSKSNRTSSARTGPNISSLCVYSGPVSPYDWCHFRRGWEPADVTPHAIPFAPAWLGTGDAGLLGGQHVDALRRVFTQSRLDRVGFSSAPHHGSKYDSGSDLWDALPNVRWVTIEANRRTSGTGNNHPHQQVLTELARRNLAAHACTDGSDFLWSDKRIR